MFNRVINKKNSLVDVSIKQFLMALCLLLLWGSVRAEAVQCNNENNAIPATTTHLQDNSDGTITDPQTGLMWKKCSEGQSWSNANNNCAGGAVRLSWQTALQQAGSTQELGYSDWRLPNIKELGSIVELRCYAPSINYAIFPSTPSAYFLSSSLNASLRSYAWTIGFNDGSDHTYNKVNNVYVRLVRSGQ